MIESRTTTPPSTVPPIHHPAGAIAYSQCWEDPETGRKALRINSGDDVLVITSGGCNALSFSLESPRSIIAVDVSPAQNYLLELKIAAIRQLNYGPFIQLLGVKPCGERWLLYSRLRDSLSLAAREFWDLRQDDIEKGVIHAGRFERYFRLFRERVLPFMHPRRRVSQFLSIDDLKEQRRFYDRHWDNRRWRLLFRVFFGRTVMRLAGGRYPGFLKYAADTDLGAHYLERARHAFREIPIGNNYFLEYILTGRYDRTYCMPPYLIEDNFGRLKVSIDRIHIETASLEALLSALPEDSVSKFYLSDIFERMSPEDVAIVFQELVRTARPGARLCYYNNLVTRHHPAEFDRVLATDVELGWQLHNADRSFFYGGVVIEEVIK